MRQTPRLTRRATLSVGMATLALPLSRKARAEGYPERPIELIVPEYLARYRASIARMASL